MLLVMPLIARGAEDRVVARVGAEEIRFADVHCEGARCAGDDQSRLEARVLALVLDAGLRRAGLAPTGADIQLRLAQELPPEAIAKMADAHRAVAEAALAVYAGERAESAHARLLLPRGVPIAQLHHFLKINSASAAGARAFLTRDLGRDIRDDLERSVRLEMKSEMLADYLQTLPDEARERFWKTVLAGSGVTIVDPAFRFPDMKGAFIRHEVQPVSSQ